MTSQELMLGLNCLKDHHELLIEDDAKTKLRILQIPESFIRGEGRIASSESLSAVILPYASIAALAKTVLLDSRVVTVLEEEINKDPGIKKKIEQIIGWSILMTGFFPTSVDLGDLSNGELKNCYVIRGGYLCDASLRDSSLFVLTVVGWLHWALKGSVVSLDGKLILGKGFLCTKTSSMEYPLTIDERCLPYGTVSFLDKRDKEKKSNLPFKFESESKTNEEIGLELTRTVALLLRDDSLARRSLNSRELAKILFYKVYLFWSRKKVLSSEFLMDQDPNQHTLDFDGGILDPINYVLGSAKEDSECMARNSVTKMFRLVREGTKLDVVKKGSLPPLGVVKVKVNELDSTDNQKTLSVELGDLLYESNFKHKLKKVLSDEDDFIVLDFRSLCFGQTSSRSVEKAHSFAALCILLAVSGSDKFSGLYGLSKHLKDTLIASGAAVSMKHDGRQFTAVEIDHRLALGSQFVYIKGYSPTKGEVGLDEWMMDARSITSPSIIKIDESYIGGKLKSISSFTSKSGNNIQAKLALHLTSPGRYEGVNYIL